MSATTPVEVSEWTRKTSETGSSSPSLAAQVVRRRRLAPGVPELLDLAAERARHRDPALAEVARRDGEHALAGRAEVDDRRLEPARAGAGEEQHVGAGAVDVLQPAEHAGVDLVEVRRAMVQHRLRERGEHLRRHRGRPGREQVPLLRHRPEPSGARGRALGSRRWKRSSPSARLSSRLRLAGMLAARWRQRRQPQLALWSAGLAAYALGAAAIAWGAAAGWNDGVFRAYYLFGGLLTAALLGAGSLLGSGVRAPRRSCSSTQGSRPVSRWPSRSRHPSPARRSPKRRSTSRSSRRACWRSSATPPARSRCRRRGRGLPPATARERAAAGRFHARGRRKRAGGARRGADRGLRRGCSLLLYAGSVART